MADVKETAQPLMRVALPSDIDQLYRLALVGGTGLTNLPPDHAALEAKLAASVSAMETQEGRESGAAILLIAELNGEVVGTSCVFPRVGADWPFYSYRITRQVSRSLAVGRRKAQELLNLVNDFDGECEVGGLFVDPACRGYAIGTLAAKARYLFIAAHRGWFGRRVIAELRGYQDESGFSPVWEAIGHHFFDMDFNEADRTGALTGNQFIADLGPRYPLYVSLLPETAREALGRPHNDGRPAFEMLLKEGFVAGDYVDIFDGGPTLVADIDGVKSIRETRQNTVRAIEEPGKEKSISLVACGVGAEFKVSRGWVKDDGTISTAISQTLGLAVGDRFHHLPI